MTHIMNTNSFDNSMHQSYNEKHQLFKPQQYKKVQQQPSQELPPTPSSSALSFLVTDQRSFEEEDDGGRLPLNTAINTTRPNSSAANYGSLSSDFTYFQTASPSTMSSPAASTISPNDDDEGLYLLWTHQLLRERGYKPSSCKLNGDEDEENDDCYSIDSSITDLSVDQQQTLTSSNNSNRHLNNNFSASYPTWLSSCFPMC
ncbi:hypothetical protein INT47_012279 [Mucor saturninus]|uniref:Uncharacterized protein n=1 Tax=Mucor saturninus TaxID=64648 RepID=A0A8H7RCQ6_9FUNG|nr:hypothetical protein INT47_012279 [Mucor saturninus]